jgi:hypothetical protein
MATGLTVVPRARVFISCGQASELKHAQSVKQVLIDLGFEAYLAGEVQSAKALRENIFAELRETEYFLFIDFRRELLSGPPECIYRGSLFSHQELAIASYLDLDILPLQEDGVKKLDGMLGHIQANATKFNDRSQLPDLVRKKVAENGWRNDWRNQLTLEESSPPSGVAHHRATNRISCFFHLTVRNHHSRVTARNCYADLRRIVKLRRPSK